MNLSFSLVLSAGLAAAVPLVASAAVMERRAAEFDRFEGQSEFADLVRKAGNLSGKIKPDDKTRLLGRFEYDFTVPQSGWYVFSVPAGIGQMESWIDGRHYSVGETGTRIGSFYLEKGKHTLTLQKRNWFHPFGKVDKILIADTAARPEERINVTGERFVNEGIIRKGESYTLDISAGMPEDSTLEAIVSDRKERKEISRVSIKLPKTHRGAFSGKLRIPAEKEGIFDIRLLLNGKPLPANTVPDFSMAVIDASPLRMDGGELKKSLLFEIDCAKQAPDYSGGGAAECVKKRFGAYRETGDVSWLSHMNSHEPSWFAYRIEVPEAQKPYLVEVDYPDDSFRTFAISLRNQGDTSYPAAAGVETGHEYPLSNRMLTHTILSWFKEKQSRLIIANACDGQRGAASKIRVYRIKNSVLPPMKKVDPAERSFSNWYEEGSGFMGLYGCDSRRKSLEDMLIGADRWAQTIAFIGGTTLYPTLMVYQFGLSPSHYNVFATGATRDLAEVILLSAEKYGMNVLFDFHPEARELQLFEDQANRLRNREGFISTFAPMYGPLHPRNQAWLCGMVSEFVNRYKSSPALKGISLRHMTWYNHALVNFNDLSWGYDDYTVKLFERETGIRIPDGSENDPGRFARRYRFLAEENREKWITWRCRKIAELYAKLAKIVREARPDLVIHSSVFSREAGVDPELLSKIENVIITDGCTYGRRGRGENNRADFLKKMESPDPNISVFTSGAAYFEATEKVIPPDQLGYPKGTRATWMSAVINPPGRLALERFAVALAKTDAKMLGDGGNAYTVGQPELRPFLKQFRAIPMKKFTLRSDGTEPVAVRTSSSDFYVVNLMPFPVKTVLRFSGNGTVTELAGKKKHSLKNRSLELNLNAFELLAFRAEVSLEGVSSEIPPEEFRKFKAQTEAIRNALPNVDQNLRGKVKELLSRLENDLNSRKFWTFRKELELAAPLLKSAGILPPFYYNDGWPVTPQDAIPAKDLKQFATGGTGLMKSADFAPDWNGEQILFSEPGKALRFKLHLPATGEYRLQAGFVSGGKFGSAEVKSGGKVVGVLSSSGKENSARNVLLTTAIPFRAGEGILELVPQAGESVAVSYLMLTPVYTVIPPMRWKVSEAFPKQSMETALAPERTHDFRSWSPLKGFDTFTDLSCGQPVKDGIIRYAVTYIHSPDDRKVRLSYGVDYTAKMWLNRTAVKPTAARTKTGTPVRGEDILDLNLKKGWNEFLVKVGSGSGGFGFWMEISNLSDLRFSPEPKDSGEKQVRLPENGKVLHHQDFERKIQQTKLTSWDGSGKEAFSGKGASKMGNYFGGAKIEGGKTYLLQAYLRGIRDGQGGRIQINWNRADGKLSRYDLAQPKLTTEWGRFQLKAKAPADAVSAFLIIGTDKGGEWVDEVWFGEVPAEDNSRKGSGKS